MDAFSPRERPDLSQFDLSLAQRVAQHAASAPQSLAVKAEAETLTYGELDLRSNQLAGYLQSQGAGPDVVVGICLERSIDSVVSQLAVLKAGAAYLPLNPAAPADRLAAMLRDAGISSVITRSDVAAKLPAGEWNAIRLDADRDMISKHQLTPRDSAKHGSDLAYVIYTSGSTGHPKGVEITRSGLENLIQWHLKAFHITAADRASLLASIGFDATVWELWPYLAAGASVHIPAEALRTQVEPLRDWLVEQSITVSFIATPLAELLMLLTWPARTALRLLLTGADTLHRRPPQGLPFSLINNYGPTECTVVATSGLVAPFGTEPKQPSIGLAIDQTQLYILDEQMRPVPQGTIGELYIGGAGLARGYRNQPKLTAEKFVDNPCVSNLANGSGSRLYRTGDRARMLRGGDIEFLGRLDDQIKIRGYRVELDEISSVLDSHPDVKASVVAAADEGDDKRLIAYLVLWPESKANAGAFRDFLQRQLPDYMIPATFVRLEALPLTNNGKVNRAALPAPNGNTLPDETYVAPRSLVEQRLAELIAPLLRVERVGVNDNFFLLGGHSLLGTQLLTRIGESFGVELSLLTIFDHPTLAGMSEEIEKMILAKIDAAPVETLTTEDTNNQPLANEPALRTGDYR
jgi:amino acid adenylation domain-containing protein